MNLVAQAEKHTGLLVLGLLSLAGLVYWRETHPPPEPLVDPTSYPDAYAARTVEGQGPGDGWVPAETYDDLLSRFQTLEARTWQDRVLTPPPPGPPGGYGEME